MAWDGSCGGARIQREAVAAVTTAGGFVKYEWEWSNGKGIPGGKPQAPSWLIGFLGVDYFGHVTYVVLDHATDTSIVQIGRLSQVEKLHLHLHGSSVSVDALLHLKRLTKLSSLLFSGGDVPDVWLVHLSGSTNLSYLNLNDTEVTDTGLAHLAAFSKLVTGRFTTSH